MLIVAPPVAVGAVKVTDACVSPAVALGAVGAPGTTAFTANVRDRVKAGENDPLPF